jgi:hypothetical protein
MKHKFNRNLSFLFVSFALASTIAQAANTKSFEITSVTSQIAAGFYQPKHGPGDKDSSIKCIKAQFRILDPTISSLDISKVYIFNQNKELIQTIEPSPQQLLSGTNFISSLRDLKTNKTYFMIFPFAMDETKFKYAIVVLGNKDKVVASGFPSSSKPEEFDFAEKEKLLK